MILKGCFYVRASLCRMCKSSIFGSSSGFGVDASHVFPQTVPALIPLVRSVSSIVLRRAYAGYGAEPPLCSMAVTALSEQGLQHSCWSRSPEDQVWSDSTGPEWVPCPKPSPWFLKLTVSFLGVYSCLFFLIFKILRMQVFFFNTWFNRIQSLLYISCCILFWIYK